MILEDLLFYEYEHHYTSIIFIHQSLSQIFGLPLFRGRQQYTEVTTINMYLLTKSRHSIIIQCHGNYIEEEILQSYACN